MLAAVEGCVPLGKLLLEHGADPSKHNAKGQTARQIAEARNAQAFAELITPK